MNKFQLLTLVAILLSISLVYAQDYSLFSGNFYDIEEGQEKINFQAYNGTYNICEYGEKSIPVLIVNRDAEHDNKYSLGIGGAGFASLNVNEFTLQKRQSGVVFAGISPKGNTEGKYGIVVTSLSSIGNLRKELKIDLNVEKCHSIDLQLEKEYDKICGGEKKEYLGDITSEGKEKIDVEIKTEGPSWVGADENLLSINPYDKEEFNIVVEAPEKESGTFYVLLTSMIKSFPSIESEKTLKLDVVPKYDCYKAEFISDAKIRSHYSPSYIPIKVKNSGIKTAEYEIRFEGQDWMQIEPDRISVNPGQQGNINLILNPSANISEGNYPIKINVKFDGITYSKSIDIVLTRDKLKDIKYFFAFYQYYIYLIVLIILVSLVFRNRIRKSYRNYRLKKLRLNALKARRIKNV